MFCAAQREYMKQCGSTLLGRRVLLDSGNAPLIKTSIGDLWIEPGVICIRIDHKCLSVPLLREQLEFTRRLDSTRPISPAPVLVDLGVLESINKEAREYAAALLNPRWNKGVGLVYHNDVQRVIASFFKGYRNLDLPVAIAPDAEEAKSRLQKAIDGDDQGDRRGSNPDRIQGIVEAVALMASGDFDIELDLSGEHDEIDALACGIGILAEETASLINLRRQAEAELVTLNRKLFEEMTERERMALRLESINAELEGFAHTVSHDLKGPLSAIGASARLVLHMRSMPRSPEIDSNIDELLWLLVSNVDKADTFIEDTLMLAEAGQVPKVVCSVDISSIVSHVLQERELQIEERGVRVVVGDDLGSLMANPTHMYQVFSNLISNAIVHNDNPRPRVEVGRLSNEDDDHMKYVVRDNGHGIPPEEIEHLFTPFFKGSHGASGLGLSIVDRVVRVYGGEVHVTNDGGACFEVTLRDYV